MEKQRSVFLVKHFLDGSSFSKIKSIVRTSETISKTI